MHIPKVFKIYDLAVPYETMLSVFPYPRWIMQSIYGHKNLLDTRDEMIRTFCISFPNAKCDIIIVMCDSGFSGEKMITVYPFNNSDDELQKLKCLEKMEKLVAFV